MLKRITPLVCSIMLTAPLQADVAPPPSCEQLHLVLDAGLLQGRLESSVFLEQLERDSGVQIRQWPVAASSVDEFAGGVFDLWLGMEQGAEPSESLLLQPALWQKKVLLWVRSGELTSLQQWPHLEGLRGGFWSQQEQDQLLEGLPEQVMREGLRRLAGPESTLRALLDGEIDYLLAPDSARQDLLARALEQGRIEVLEPPLELHSFHLAFSGNSVCKDAATVNRLQQALASATTVKTTEKKGQKKGTR